MSERQVDPWGDMPRWSDGEAAASSSANAEADPTAADASTSAPTAPAASPASDAPAQASASDEPHTCPWCATPAAEGATRCSNCGAALAQRESIGDLVVPGLTAVDPALKDFDSRPLHLRGPSPTQGVASGLIVAAAAGGPIGLAIIGGVGAVAAAEYMGAGGEKGKGHEHVGETSEAVLQALERLERGEQLPTASDETPRPDVATAAPAAGAQSANTNDAKGGNPTTGATGPEEEASDGG
jgi:hypothetical protein